MQFLKYFYSKKLIISITLRLGLLILIIEGIIDYIEPDATYSSYNLLIYVLIFPIFILFGITIANAMDESKKLNRVMKAIIDVNQIIIREKYRPSYTKNL
ncbi:hypothetical protein Metev_0386 [Methanohalobium evestigatum Z-7303]|uniref:Uncharacterized protein n=1 Tax=Methanohalobium evestigatum (strain ATCC BAA-1072 / DSM 3721 / NBRC 107634 / OCM 161 / Z-7303) TaxID=644295 RepID=D7E7W3_METEZ|nr:hypothetical protein [Methanohalobium evestigatum]ADI73305.1 hypothetical protein Metev_0386 [Methanohalobium evestigatum Z-7303]